MKLSRIDKSVLTWLKGASTGTTAPLGRVLRMGSIAGSLRPGRSAVRREAEAEATRAKAKT